MRGLQQEYGLKCLSINFFVSRAEVLVAAGVASHSCTERPMRRKVSRPKISLHFLLLLLFKCTLSFPASSPQQLCTVARALRFVDSKYFLQ